MRKEEDRNLPKLDIADINFVLGEISKEMDCLSSRMIGLGIEFVNKMSGGFISEKNDRFFKLRNNIQFRLGSILFHFSLLVGNHIKSQKKISAHYLEGNESTNHLFVGSDQQYALFDSIIFHIVSLFDYLACLINYTCSGKYESKLKWNSIVKTSFAQDSFLDNSKLKEVLQKWNNDFVNALYNHRSDLIHYNMDSGSSAYSIGLLEGKASLEIESPSRFIKNFRELRELSKEHTIMINFSVNWTINKTLSATKEIINEISIFMDSNRKVPTGKEVFFIDKSKNRI